MYRGSWRTSELWDLDIWVPQRKANNHIHLKYIGMCCSLYDENSANVDIITAGKNNISVKGINDYHFNWLGFEGPDMVAVIDFEELTKHYTPITKY